MSIRHVINKLNVNSSATKEHKNIIILFLMSCA